MAMVNPFDVFSVTEIGMAINRIPNTYGRVSELGLFPVRGLTGNSVFIEEQNGSLALLLSDRPRGPGAQVGSIGKRVGRTFTLPKFTQDEWAGPQEVMGVRAFGGNEQDSLARLLNQKLMSARAKHDITLEFLRMGALQGLIRDGDGSTLFNLYTEFGITQLDVDFLLGTAGTDVSDKCREVVDHIQDNLQGETMSGVRALVSPEFFNKLIKHPKVEKFYLSYASVLNNLQGSATQFNTFVFAGIQFESYRAITADSNGDALRFIAANEGHAFPEGATQSFATFVGPADFNETVGQIGQIYYAKTQPSKMDRGWDIHTQSNPLPMVARPALLVKVHTSN